MGKSGGPSAQAPRLRWPGWPLHPIAFPLAFSYPIDAMMPARYVDAFEKRGGIWRITQRTTIFEGRYILKGDNAALDPAWTVGQRDRSDPLYVTRRHAGLMI